MGDLYRFNQDSRFEIRDSRVDTNALREKQIDYWLSIICLKESQRARRRKTQPSQAILGDYLLTALFVPLLRKFEEEMEDKLYKLSERGSKVCPGFVGPVLPANEEGSGTAKNVEESEDKKSGKEDKQMECAELGKKMSKELLHLILTPTTYDTVEFYQVINTKVKGCYGLADGSEGFPELIMKGDGSERVDGINHMVSRPDHDGKTKLKSERDHVHQTERSELQDKYVADARHKLCLYLAGNFLDLSMNSVYKFCLAF
ncbi:hypothetical protein Tco_0468478 [Tanacetum coccineum]